MSCRAERPAVRQRAANVENDGFIDAFIHGVVHDGNGNVQAAASGGDGEGAGDGSVIGRRAAEGSVEDDILGRMREVGIHPDNMRSGALVRRARGGGKRDGIVVGGNGYDEAVIACVDSPFRGQGIVCVFEESEHEDPG